MTKTPARMCMVCKQMQAKNNLIRVVRTPDGQIMVDRSGKLNGRGAYVCNNDQCITKCIKAKLLHKTFRQDVPNHVYNNIKEYNE